MDAQVTNDLSPVAETDEGVSRDMNLRSRV